MTVVRGAGRPEGYYTADGRRVPSVTTITNRFKNMAAMVRAANSVGLEGKTLEEAWYGPALSVGDQVHKMVEATLHGETPPEATSLEAMNAYQAWSTWWRANAFEVVATELPLVSERHRFGGTIDTVLRNRDGALCIGDWKSSNGIYSDYLIQVAAYGLLWSEHNPNEPLTGGYHIVRFGKEAGDLEHRHFPELGEAEHMFLLLREAYDLDRTLSRRAR